MKKVLVIGYGSIGTKHARLLSEIGCDVSLMSRREISDFTTYKSIDVALKNAKPEYVVIANETTLHWETLIKLNNLNYDGHVLIEKPLAVRPVKLPENLFKSVSVAYNLRFHPLLLNLKKKLRNEEIISVQVYCGQYLPYWRPDIDYRRSYSANMAKGGGVLLDLSHEINYLSWLLGHCHRLSSILGNFSALEIDSYDSCAILAQFEKAPIVTLNLNYLDRLAQRKIVINTNKHTFLADLNASTLTSDAGVNSFLCGRDDTYREQHKAILGISSNELSNDELCNFEEANNTLSIIAAVESSFSSNQWIIP